MHRDLFTRPLWGTPVEVERRRRIQLSLWSYAYELTKAPMVHDDHYDSVARMSDRNIITGRLDGWWFENFDPSTGMWVRDHPELDLLANLHWRITHARMASSRIAGHRSL